MKKFICVVALLCAGCGSTQTTAIAPSTPADRSLENYKVELLFTIDSIGTDTEVFSFESDGHKFFVVTKMGYAPSITSVPIQEPTIKIGPEL